MQGIWPHKLLALGGKQSCLLHSAAAHARHPPQGPKSVSNFFTHPTLVRLPSTPAFLPTLHSGPPALTSLP